VKDAGTMVTITKNKSVAGCLAKYQAVEHHVHRTAHRLGAFQFLRVVISSLRSAAANENHSTALERKKS